MNGLVGTSAANNVIGSPESASGRSVGWGLGRRHVAIVGGVRIPVETGAAGQLQLALSRQVTRIAVLEPHVGQNHAEDGSRHASE